MAEDRLIYACAGMAIEPGSPLATAAAAETAAAAAADVEAPGHHHRHLLQTGGNAEWGSTWLVSSGRLCVLGSAVN